MATVSLDKIRADIEARYAPVVIDLGGGLSCTLVQAMRLPKHKRVALVNSQRVVNAQRAEKGDDDYDEDLVVGHLRNIIELVATSTKEAQALIDAIGDDLSLLGEVVNEYGRASQLPEA